MSEISSINGAAGSISRPQAPAAASREGVIPGRTDAQRDHDRDRVELSDRARLINRLRELPEVRADRVAAAREAIADPDFANDERLNVAIERLMEDLDLDAQLR